MYTRAGNKRTVHEDDNGLLYLCEGEGTIVEFGYIDKGDNNKWWSSREGIFNRDIPDTAILCVVDGMVRHYHLEFVRRKIAECGQDIRFFRITQFQDREVYYTPYEPHKRDYVLAKLEQAYSVFDIEDID
jgi:hypothetical protein